VGYYTHGLLSFKMDRTGKVLAKDDFWFSDEFARQFQKEPARDKDKDGEEKGKAGIPDLVVRNVSLGTDGSTTVIGEQQMIYTKNFETSRGTSQKTYFYYSDVVATKYDKNGKLLWMKKLPKTQLGYMGKGMMGIRYIRGKSFHYVLYVDHQENTNPDYLNAGVPKIYNDNEGGYLMAYKIDDATGNTERHTIADVKDIKGIEAFQFRTTRIFDADDNTFLLEVYLKGKEDTLIKMVLN
jgi:outer membrane lipoprotein-sorting protein